MLLPTVKIDDKESYDKAFARALELINRGNLTVQEIRHITFVLHIPHVMLAGFGDDPAIIGGLIRNTARKLAPAMGLEMSRKVDM